MNFRKKLKVSSKFAETTILEPFEKLPDDLVIAILSKLCSSSSSPSAFINALIVCKRFNELGMNKLVLSKASSKVFDIRARNWSDSAHRFLKLCVNAGSVEACYFLGMVRFYCLENRKGGASLMAKAAMKSHAQALYSLAVIQFNGSGGLKSDKDLRTGVLLCARAAYLGHVDALRELGHCLQDGYGVKQNVAEGCKLLVQAKVRELACILHGVKFSSLYAKVGSHWEDQKEQPTGVFGPGCLTLLSPMDPHPANRFLVEWFKLHGEEMKSGLRLCSYSECGRLETRPHEFRRCSVCGAVNYCSRGCQALDWKVKHKVQCSPIVVEQWGDVDPIGDGLHIGVADAQPLGHYHQVG